MSGSSRSALVGSGMWIVLILGFLSLLACLLVLVSVSSRYEDVSVEVMPAIQIRRGPQPNVSFVHVVNAYYRSPEDNSGHIEMNFVNEALLRAKERARQANIDVEIIMAGYAEDRPAVPDGVTFVLLSRSTLDVEPLASFIKADEGTKEYKFPFLEDILDCARMSESTHIVLSNPDIIIGEDFYVAAAADQAEHNSFGVFSYTRRKVESDLNPSSATNLEQVFAVKGYVHPGHDCFVFSRSVFGYVDLGDAVLGAGVWGQVLIAQLDVGAVLNDPLTQQHVGVIISERTWHLWGVNEWSEPHRKAYQDWNTLQEAFAVARTIKAPYIVPLCRGHQKVFAKIINYVRPPWLDDLWAENVVNYGDPVAAAQKTLLECSLLSECVVTTPLATEWAGLFLATAVAAFATAAKLCYYNK